MIRAVFHTISLQVLCLFIVIPYFLLLFCFSLKFTLGSLLGSPEFDSPFFDPLLLLCSPSNLSLLGSPEFDSPFFDPLLLLCSPSNLSMMAIPSASPSSHLSSCQESQECALVEFSTSPCRLSIVSLFAQLPSSFATSSSPGVHPFSPPSVFCFYYLLFCCGRSLLADFLSRRGLPFLVHSFLRTYVHFVLLCCPICWSRLLQLMLRFPLMASQVAVSPCRSQVAWCWSRFGL